MSTSVGIKSDLRQLAADEHDEITTAKRVVLIDTTGAPYVASGGLQPVQLKLNGTTTPATLDTSVATNNHGIPVISLAGEGLGPLAAGTGASSALTRRVVLSSDSAVNQAGTWNINNVSGVVSLPTGAATQTTLAAADTKLGSIDTKLVSGANGIKGDAYQAGTWDVRNVTGSVSLPTGASTETTLAAINTKTVAGTNGQKVDAYQAGTWTVSNLPVSAATGTGTSNASTLRTVIASDQVVKTSQQSRSLVAYALLNYTSTTSASFTAITLVPSGATVSAANEISFTDTSGQPMLLAIDTAGGTSFTVPLLAIPANGSGVLNVAIPAGSSIGVRSLGTTVTSGSLVLNILG